MFMPPDSRLHLDPQDEYTHTPEAAANYNESMYFNAFDTARGIGAWMRLGNRPNEGHAEMTCCVYLPDGRVGFMYGRPPISDNEAMDAGGLRFEVLKPFKRLRVSYEGELLIMDDPHAMADPGSAFKRYPKRRAAISLDYEGISPMHGGEIVALDGSRFELDPEHSVYRGHTEQNMAVRGHITVDGVRHEIDGFGYRDKSWGPRHWSAINWYRWCPLNFGRDFGMMLSVIGDGKGGARQGGMVFVDGQYDLIKQCEIESDWDEAGYQTALRAKVKTESGRAYEVTGKVMSLIPLRNRRTAPDGTELQTRITEGMTEYRCGELVGYGLSEYLDQIVDGKPNGKEAGY